jgi:predicted TIM-barrel fold metal-dependent hydrolase
MGSNGATIAADDLPVLLVSGDSHVGPTLETLREYCPKERLQAFDDHAASPGVTKMRELLQSSDRTYLKTLGHADPDVRLAEMDADGVAAEVIFHNSFNGEPLPLQDRGWPNPDHPELAADGFRIYNRWLADFCSVAPERLIGLAHLPMWDLDAAIEELLWAADHGFRGVNFPATRPGWKHYDHPDWEPFWSVAEERAIVLTTHAGGGSDPAAMDAFGNPLQLIESGGTLNRRPIPRMIIGGVFERHPALRLVMTEQPGVWIPYMLTELDSAVLGMPVAIDLPKPPSEYFKTNVFVGTSFIAPFEAQAAVDDWWWTNIFWGRDYPHPEGTWRYTEDPTETPMTHLSLRHAMAGLPLDQVRAIVGTNAVGVYGLDGDALRAVANKIGPSIEEITAPLDEIPSLEAREGNGFFSFRTLGPWA